MSEKLHHLLGSLPFLLMTMDGKIKGNKTRLIETALIIGVLAGMGYMALKGIEGKLTAIEKSIELTNVKVDKIYTDIYKPVMPRP